MGYEDSIIFENPDYDSAIIGVSESGSVVYDFDLMVDFLVREDGLTEEEAIEFIEYNTIRAIPYISGPKPTILYRFTDLD